jgi:hypothetical protein
MTTLMQANRQWSSRAPDERFTSLIISSRRLAIEPVPEGPPSPKTALRSDLLPKRGMALERPHATGRNLSSSAGLRGDVDNTAGTSRAAVGTDGLHDSPLEGAGFELRVPLPEKRRSDTHHGN